MTNALKPFVELGLLQTIIKTTMALSFKNRIASYYIFTTAFLVFGVFFGIFSMVKISVYNHVDQDIFSEVKKHLGEIKMKNEKFYLFHENELAGEQSHLLSIHNTPKGVYFIRISGNDNKISQKLLVVN